MAEDRIHEEKVGTPPPGSEQSTGPPPGAADRANEPADELARDPHIHDADPTNERADEVRHSLEHDEDPRTARTQTRIDREPIDRGAYPVARDAPLKHEAPLGGPTPATPPRDTHGNPPVGGQEDARRVSPRPFSPQAEEGQHEASPHERTPYDDVPRADTLGTRHIVEAMRDLTFPMSREQLLARAGDWRIPVTGRSFRTLREYMAGVDEDEFGSPEDVERAVQRQRKRDQFGRHHT